MLHLGGWGESIDAADAEVNIAAIPDDVLQTNGDDLRIPPLNEILAIAAGVASGGDGYAKLTAPSLLTRTSFFVSPTNGNADDDAEPDSPPAVMDMRENPLRMQPTEDAEALVQSDTTSAQFQWLLAWFSDGRVTRPQGDIFTVRATASTTLSADSWTNAQITFAENLPAGRYAVVGMSAISDGLVAARLVFKGNTPWRPGCLGRDSDNDKEHPMFRHGGLGVWGEFEHTVPPDVEFLSVSGDSSEDVLLDLIKIRGV